MAIEAWIDVGGTFTDCYIVDRDGRRSTKVLSSGLVPVSIRVSENSSLLVAKELAGDGDDFWIGSRLKLATGDGQRRVVGQIAGFDRRSATIRLDRPSSDSIPSDARFEIDSGLEAPVLAVRRLLNCSLAGPLPPLQIRLGTTRGTNALLTRRGAPTALAITAPFEDLLAIGDQTRPHLFELAIPQREVLAKIVLGVEERLDASGGLLVPLNRDQAARQLRMGIDHGCTSLAICLMHSYLNPQHEMQIEMLARELGYEHISRSSQLAPLIEIVARAQTTLVDAYLGPVIRTYLEKLVDQFGGLHQTQLRVMTSAGGLVDWRQYSGKDSILSGPAGGVVGLAAVSRAARQPRTLGLDMGGTSTDVSRVGDEYELEYESTKAGVRILTPTLPIETVAAGGGSVCWFDGVSLRVGPHSAGASPGPACYGRNGPLTITDLNVFLGRIPSSQFPFPLDLSAVSQRMNGLLESVSAAGLNIASVEPLAQGLRTLANQTMAEAVRSVSIAQGVDPRDHAIVGFGGAAGQHICEIAEQLGIAKIIDSADAGMLSALGMGLAKIRRNAAVPVYKSIANCDWSEVDRDVQSAERELTEQLQTETDSEQHIFEIRRWLEARSRGTDAPLTISWCQPEQIADRFHAEHYRKFGYRRESAEIEIVSVRLDGIIQTGHDSPSPSGQVNRFPSEGQRASNPPNHFETHLPHSETSVRFWDRESWQNVRAFAREALVIGATFNGPAIVLNRGSTLVIERNWECEVLPDGALVLYHRKQETNGQENSGQKNEEEKVCDPILRDVFAQRLSAIATQMGLVLQKTAVSVNVKQRRDFSCAVFDAQGRLLANAPHVPVHLGAMGETVRAVLKLFPNLRPGDTFVTNDPYRGGSHLPDVTVITPVFRTDTNCLSMFTASRAHHADIGGITPGSMSVVATTLAEEGCLIPPMHLTRLGHDESDRLRSLLESAQWPPRNIGENMSDIAAQQAANMRGANLIEGLASSFPWASFETYGGAILQVAADRVANYFKQHPQAVRHFVDHLDDGTPIAASIDFPTPGGIRIDFAGTGPVSPTNFNANRSIVTAAVMYVLRCLIADDLPLNEGVMQSVELLIPPGILDPLSEENRHNPPAVAAGNVETSQRVVDCLLGAFEAAAASQGTMNNLLFGNARFGFYETICGGSGATESANGASGVHTHMTNTRLTDAEVLEARYPVRLEQFGLRTLSGGAGRWRGGEGVIRRMRFLEPVQLSLLTSRRGEYPPYGLAGGNPGQIGHNTLILKNGDRRILPNCCQMQVEAGDAIEIQTPGGGGFGPA